MDQSVFETYESEVRSYCRKFPTVFTKAKNAALTDQQGKTYIDFFCGAGACNYGHNNDYIKAKVMDYLAGDGIIHSMDMYTVTKGEFIDFFETKVLQPRGITKPLRPLWPERFLAAAEEKKGPPGSPGGPFSVCSDQRERLVQVGDQVVGILNADGQAHLAVKDLGGVALLGCHVEVAHGGGVLDEGVHIAQTGSQGQGGFRVLQMGDLLFQLVAVGAAEAGVGKALIHMLVQIHGGIKVLQHIGACLINGAHVGHGRRLVGAPQAGMDLLRVQNIIR